MQNRWNDRDAADFVARYRDGCNEDLALRTYTSRLIGADPALVLHGGGNTSCKTRVRDVLGDEVDVLCVKGSGWDLATIEPAGLPAVELAPLVRLRALESLSDEEMVNQLRRRLLDVRAPTPSVETLLHAFLPHRFVDHTHADAILELTDQPDGEARVRELYGDEMAVLPWIMPGFPLAKAVADAWESAPDAIGVVLLRHGVFTFGETAQQSYERMIDVVDRAERAVEAGIAGKATIAAVPADADLGHVADRAAEVLPVVRGALALDGSDRAPGTDRPGDGWKRWIASHRGDADLVAIAGHRDAVDLLARGPLTPDHVIRTKGPYLVLEADVAGDADRCRAAVSQYAARYREYFERNAARATESVRMLDPHPRVVVVGGVGILAFGDSKKAADVAADLAEHTLRSKARAEALGRYEALTPDEYFEMEYWSLEQAKLGKKTPAPLAGKVALVTGAAGAIGAGICESLLDAGAHVFATDIDEGGLERVVARLGAGGRGRGGALVATPADITSEDDVARTFAVCARTFGGVDVVVPNAGIAHVAGLSDMDTERFRRVQDVNTTGTMLVLKHAARVFAAQRTGGDVVLQASKNAFAPGANFGAYSASKAAALQLGKIAALELAPLGVRVNMINADAVFGDDEVPSRLWELVGPERMKSRGLDAQGLRDYYRERSLLKVPVTPRAVGEAVVFFASGRTPTTGATLPVDGGIPEAFPR